MDKSIAKQLKSYFILFSIILSVIFIGSMMFIVRQTFEQYKSNNIELRNQSIVDYLIVNYDLETGYKDNVSSELNMMVQQRQIDLTIYDPNKNALWSRNFTMGHMGHMRQRGNLVTTQYPLVKENQTFGYVDIRQSASSFLTQEDAVFLRNLFIGTLVASLVGLMIASIFAFRFSRRLSKPIIDIKDVAQEIKAGNLSLRINNKSRISEFKDLSEAINDMSATLERQQILRRTLANNISHELRTPLYVMKTHLEGLSDGVILPGEDTYQTIHNEINQLSHIVFDLEQLNDLEENFTLNEDPTNLRQFLSNFLLSYENIVEAESKRLSFSMEDNITLLLDQMRIRQVLTNLMSNALRFTGVGDVISLSVEILESSIMLAFKDTGSGIAEEDLPYIFERFYRSEIKNNTLENGAGLGLSIVKEIIHLHNGSITVNSVAGEYTEFKIILPMKISS